MMIKTILTIIAFVLYAGTASAEPISIKKINVAMTEDQLFAAASELGMTCYSQERRCAGSDTGIMNFRASYSDVAQTGYKVIIMECTLINACETTWSDLSKAMENRFNIKFDITQKLQSKYLKTEHICAEGADKDKICLTFENDVVFGLSLEKWKMGAKKLDF